LESKKTKVFKFIDYEWRLAAQAGTDNLGQRKLTISLLMEKASTEVESVTNIMGSNIDEPIARSGTASSALRTTASQFYRGDFVKIGVLYLKLVTKIE
jgi:hypothetical protein